MTKLIVLLVVLAVAGITAFKSGFWAENEDGGLAEGTTYTVVRDDLKITLNENGTLMAKNSAKVTLKSRRGGKITSLVEEGKAVEEGEILCQLETKDLESRLETIDLDIVQSDANLKSARTEVEIQTTENEGAIEKATNTFEKAGKDLERYEEGDAPQERRKLDIAIKDAQTDFTRAKKRYEDSQKLFDQEYINKTELEDHEIQFEKNKVKQEEAELNRELFERYTYPMTLKERKTALKDGRRDLDSAKKRAESRLRQKEVAVVQNEKRLKRLNKQKKDYEEDIANMSVKAPCPGIVLYGDPRNSWFRQNIKVGGEIWGGNTLFTIPDLRIMQVKLKVHEADINKIKLEQTAKVTMDTYPGVVLTGKVAKIASIANASNPYGGRNDDVKKFDVMITLDEEAEVSLKPGISAKVEVHIEDRPQVLFVPLQSVVLEDAVHFCNVVGANGQPERREVKVGLSNESYIEVLEGLDEGDTVLLYNPDFGHGTTKKIDDGKKTEDGGSGGPGAGQSPAPGMQN